MQEVRSKLVFTSLEEVVAPGHAAVLIVDMQNGLASPEGYAARHGSDVSTQQAIIPALVRLLNAARQSGVRVVHIKIVFDKDIASIHPAWVYQSHRMHGHQAFWGRPNSTERKPLYEFLVDGTWEAEIISGLSPQPGDFVVAKHRNSAFVNTPLDQVLRANGIQSVVITGTSTAGCVLATALDAQWYDYYTVVLRDCVADVNPKRHQTGMSLLEERFDVPASEEVISLWAKARAGAAIS